MADNTPPDKDDAEIIPPDHSLRQKIGKINLDKIFTKKIVDDAQGAIIEAVDMLVDETREALENLKELAGELENVGSVPRILPAIIRGAFFVRARCGLSDYGLVAEISRSLQIYCERLKLNQFAAKDRDIIRWHVQTMEALMKSRIKGDGGEVGATIMAEIKRLEP